MNVRSLRFRMTLWYASLLLASVCLLSFVLWRGVHIAVVSASDERLQGLVLRGLGHEIEFMH